MRISNLRPFGRVRPHGWSRAHLTAWWHGIMDGWNQPYELSTSWNVEHLTPVWDGMVQESLDCGINLGQWLRSPLHHEVRS